MPVLSLGSGGLANSALSLETLTLPGEQTQARLRENKRCVAPSLRKYCQHLIYPQVQSCLAKMQLTQTDSAWLSSREKFIDLEGARLHSNG